MRRWQAAPFLYPGMMNGGEEELHLLETPRLVLRHFLMEDAKEIRLLSGEKAYRRWLPDQVYATLQEAEGVLEYLISRYEGKELPYVLAIEEKKTGSLIGHVGVSSIAQGLEIGYAIGRCHQNRGYATEAVEAFSDWAKQIFASDRLFGLVRTENYPSRRVLEKAGFWRVEGKENPADSILYAK